MPSSHLIKRLCLAAAAALALAMLATSPGLSLVSASSSATQLTVSTNDGLLKGAVSADAREFLGVPYAQPPVYDLRFAPPQPAQPWAGVRDASRQAPACIQFQPSGVRNSQATSEDCLYLDIYTPKDARPGAKLPVVLWAHGGGNTQGTGVIYGGQRFATLTNSIFVSINYRLGAFGFLALAQLDQASTGSYGLLDQIAALKWVNNNIAAFGGNPHNITIDGQSAGGDAVCNMLASPMAAGLFERAIMESHACLGHNQSSLSAAEATGENYAAAVGCTDPATVVNCLRGVQPYAIANSAWTPNQVAAEQKVLVRGAPYGTAVLPEATEHAIASGNWNKVPLLVGSVHDEAKLLSAFGHFDITADEYAALIQSQFGANADGVLAHYPASNYPRPFYALAAVGTDSGNACNSYWFAGNIAAQTPTWEEEFNDPTSPTLFGFQPPGIDMSNAHSAELAYLWNFTLGDRPLTNEQIALGKQMDKYWAAFARSGNPNVAGQASWPQVTAGTHPVIDLRPTGNTVSTTEFAAEHQCAFWASIEPSS
ncbi:MAG TPA: carboxylesterase family protein [Jatrophihabitans sp.]|jgi:para-nitrobenzyl esterase|nr:carboxylesterase family protein [Jatrophihabitans sp.]